MCIEIHGDQDHSAISLIKPACLADGMAIFRRLRLPVSKTRTGCFVALVKWSARCTLIIPFVRQIS